MENDVIFRTGEASKGAFQGIRKVQGRLTSIKRIPSRFETTFDGKGEPSDQVEITLEDAAILVMDEGEPEPELRDDAFTFWLTYAQPGKPKPHKNTFYVKGFLASGEALGIFPEWQDKFVTLERQEIVLFKRRNEEGELMDITQESYVLVDGEAGVDAPSVDEYVKTMLVGKNKSAALRVVLLDNRIKHRTDIVAAVRDGSIVARLGLYEDEKGVYQDAEPAVTKMEE